MKTNEEKIIYFMETYVVECKTNEETERLFNHIEDKKLTWENGKKVDADTFCAVKEFLSGFSEKYYYKLTFKNNKYVLSMTEKDSCCINKIYNVDLFMKVAVL